MAEDAHEENSVRLEFGCLEGEVPALSAVAELAAAVDRLLVKSPQSSVKQNSVPPDLPGRHQIRPLCWSTIVRQVASPSPVPS